MKEELQGKLVEILTNIQAAAGKASDFAIGQLPDIAQSYITFGRVYETMWVLACVSLLALSVWGCVRLFKQEVDEFPLMMIPISLSGLLLVLELRSFFLVWLAPKVWLLKELAQMVR